MTLLLQPDHSKPWFWQLRLLPFVWLGGLFLGLLLYCGSAPSFFSLMRSSVSVSIVGCFFSSFLPFSISAFAAIIHRPWFLLAAVFFKGLCYAYISIGLLSVLGDGSWLIRLFFMLPDICSLPLLYVFWQRCLRFGGLPPVTEFLFWLCGLILIIGMDFYVFFPFFTGLNIL